MTCPGSGGDMPKEFYDNLWNTPKRGSKRWLPGFQDMDKLTGYARLKYNKDRTKCNVTIYTRTRTQLSLIYSFDGIDQAEPFKVFDMEHT